MPDVIRRHPSQALPNGKPMERFPQRVRSSKSKPKRPATLHVLCALFTEGWFWANASNNGVWYGPFATMRKAEESAVSVDGRMPPRLPQLPPDAS